MNKTLDYYAHNAELFVADTGAVDFSAVRNRFLAKLQSGASILDLGCGSGRDTEAFLERGFAVTAADGSPELCALAEARTGIPVRRMLFRELDDRETYDGIWANASILHVPSAELPEIFRLVVTALKAGGVLYISFKYGTFEGDRNGRYYTDHTEETFAAFLTGFPELNVEEQWISGDVRPGRSAEKWLNTILRKNE